MTSNNNISNNGKPTKQVIALSGNATNEVSFNPKYQVLQFQESPRREETQMIGVIQDDYSPKPSIGTSQKRSAFTSPASQHSPPSKDSQQPTINISVSGIPNNQSKWSPPGKKPLFQAGVLFPQTAAGPPGGNSQPLVRIFEGESGPKSSRLAINEHTKVIDSITTQMITHHDDDVSGGEADGEVDSPIVIGMGGLSPQNGGNMQLVPMMRNHQIQVMPTSSDDGVVQGGRITPETPFRNGGNSDLKQVVSVLSKNKPPSSRGSHRDMEAAGSAAASAQQNSGRGNDANEEVENAEGGTSTANASSRPPPTENNNKSILSTKLNLEPVIAAAQQQQLMNNGNNGAGGVPNITPDNTSRRKNLEFSDPPLMSSRRRQMNMQTPQQNAISSKVANLCTASETQPIFIAIWKVVLTVCFEQQALKNYMRRGNLINVPIRALHYSEILCLFKKAHGPILGVKKAEDLTASAEFKAQIAEVARKKDKTVTATDTVQGFVHYNIFCRDIVRMLGDAVLLVNSQVYSLILQLVFEACSIQTTTAGNDDVIYLRRITDITSPFENSVTDNLPVNKIFRLNTLSIVIKYFCMQEIMPVELKRLTERRFVPQMLKNSKQPAKGDPQPVEFQLFDDVEKVIQHSSWKDKRLEQNDPISQQKSAKKTPRRDDSTLNNSTINKIMHKSKFQRTVTFPTPSAFTEMEQSPDRKSEMTSDDGKQEEANIYRNMQPKLPMSHTPQTIQLGGKLGNRMNSVLNQQMDSPMNRQPVIHDVIPSGGTSTQFHVKVGSTVAPRTPQANQRRSHVQGHPANTSSLQASQMTVTNQTMDLSGGGHTSEPFSFQNGQLKARPVTNEVNKRQVVSPTPVQVSEKGGVGDASSGPVLEETFEKARRGLDQPLKLMDTMQMNNKYRLLQLKNNKLLDAKEFLEIKQFGVQRQMFEKMRARAAKPNRDDSFNIQINSHGKLDEFKDDIQPIDEMGEIINDLSKEIEAEDVKRAETTQYDRQGTLRIDPLQELFDFKSLLQQSFKRSNTVSEDDEDAIIAAASQHANQMDFESPRSDGMVSDELQSDQLGDGQPKRSTTHDPMNIRKKFNSKNLQQQRAKNKQLIAHNMRQFNEMRQMKGYNACLQTGKRYNTQKRRPHNSTNFKMPKLGNISTTLDSNQKRRGADNFSPKNDTLDSYLVTKTTTTRNPSIEQGSLEQYSEFGIRTPPEHLVMTPTMESSMITNLQIGNVSKQFHQLQMQQASKTNNSVITKGATTSSRRPSYHSQIGSVAASNVRQKFGTFNASPDPQSSQRQRPSIFSQNHPNDDISLNEAINCQTIPKLVKDIQARQMEKGVGTSPMSHGNKQYTWNQHDRVTTQQSDMIYNEIAGQTKLANAAIPIHLHLDKQADQRNEFSPFSLHLASGTKDSLDALGRRSRDHAGDIINPDDGIQTMRAESHLDTAAAKNVKLKASKAESCMNTNAKIVLVAARGQPPDQVLVAENGSQEFTVAKRTRVVSTAEAQSRNKAIKLGIAQRSTKEKGSKGESIGKMSDHGKVKISLLLEEKKIGSRETKPKNDKQSLKNNEDLRQMGMDDLNRWNASMEEQSRELLLSQNGSEPNAKEGEAGAIGEDEAKRIDLGEGFQRTKPKNAIEIDYQVSQTKPHTSNPEQQKRSLFQEKQEKFFQRGEFIAPRRNLTRKQRAKTKAPINLLAMHDYKGTRNLNINMINPDLFTSRQDTTETERLNYSHKTPDRQVHRRISIQDPRLTGAARGRVSPATPNQLRENNRRSPTPIKIVDLSANPVSMPTCMTSIKQDYLRHFPLLNSNRPLKQEQLTNMMAKDQMRAMMNVTADATTTKHLTQMTPRDVKSKESNQRKKISRGHSLNIKDSDSINLKAKVSYLVSSPLTSPKLDATGTTATFMPSLTMTMRTNMSKY